MQSWEIDMSGRKSGGQKKAEMTLVPALCLLLPLLGFPNPDSAQAKSDGSFPGKGSYTSWVNANTFLKFGNDFAQRGELDRALESYKKAIHTYPFDSVYYFNLANAFSLKGQHAIAEESYQKAIELEDGYFQAWVNLGHAIAKQGRSAEAAQALRKAAQMSKNPIEKEELEKNAAQLEQLAQMQEPQESQPGKKKKKTKVKKEKKK